jgi:hypothetical protein
MLTKADEYPIHQTPEPIAFSGTDPNFYDRFFFNGYEKSGAGGYFAVAFGVYPHIGVMDGAFSTIRDGVQRSVFASRQFDGERMDTHAGPVSIEIVEPLRALRVRVAPNDFGIEADLVFRSLTPLIEEPRFIMRNGTRTLQDVTRMTQLGSWSGWISVDGVRQQVDPKDWRGCRDRSWGVRPLGSARAWTATQDEDATKAEALPKTRDAEGGFAQFFWLWAPLVFDDCGILYFVNENDKSVAWHTNAVVAPSGGPTDPYERMSRAAAAVRFASGTRWAAEAEIVLTPWHGPDRRIVLEPKFRFHMMGVGYAHPKWQHGMNKGPLDVGGEAIVLADIDPAAPLYQHIQSVCVARMIVPGEKDRIGAGTLEQLVLGPHDRYGFKNLLDLAP